MDCIRGKKILVTGGSGFLGRALVERLQTLGPREIVVASRDEVKHARLREKFPDVTYYICDVRDYPRLRRACYGVDIIIHAAAMKRVESCGFDPQEALKTNVHGSQNVVEAAIDHDVSTVIGVSSDKSFHACTIYGHTKAAMETLFLNSNSYNLAGVPCFSVVRYPNVLGSTGSVIPLFLEQKKKGVLTVTDERMTRFVIRIEDAVDLILSTIETNKPGVYFPKDLAAMRVMDMAEIIAPNAAIKIIGLRDAEKLHEAIYENPDGSICSSDKPPRWFSKAELVDWLNKNYPGWE